MTAATRVADEVRLAMTRITGAWRDGDPGSMAPLLDPNVVMVFPGFTGRLHGRDAFIGSFRTFVSEARVVQYSSGRVQVDGNHTSAVAQYPFEMVYEREGARYRSTGWDVWVFSRDGKDWLAVWRTMHSLSDEPVE